jgi:hypothetical protein
MFNVTMYDRHHHGEESEEGTLATALLPEISPDVAAGLNQPFSTTQRERRVSHTQSFVIPRKPVNPSAASSPGFVKSDIPRDEAGQSSGIAASSHSNQASIFHTWWVEIGSCVVVLGALFAIFGILYPHQNAPLPNWPYSISINSLVSIFVVIMKGAMLLVLAEGLSQLKWVWFKKPRQVVNLADFDMASRGPYGSFHFLYALRGQHIVASIGAFLTMAALVIDPFAQQVVRYYNCNAIESSVNATIPRTNVFYEVDYHIAAGMGLLPAGMQTAINAGLFSPAGVTIPFNCPTGNCTFPNKYHTMGYCSSCSDITDDLKVVVTNHSSVTQGYYSNGTTYPVTYYYILYNTTLPSGLNAMFGSGAPVNQSFLTIAPFQTAQQSAIQMIYAPGSWDTYPSPWGGLTGTFDMCSSWGCKPGYGAAQCSFNPCVRTYSASIHDGKLSETYEGNFSVPMTYGYNSYYVAAVNLPCLSSQQRQVLLQAGYDVPPGAEWISYNSSGFNISTANGVLGPDAQHCVYSFLLSNQLDIYQFLSSFMSGSVEPYGTGFNGPNVAMHFFNQGTFEGVQQSMANITESITKNIRQISYANLSQPALGIVYRQETCVHVYWGWLAFPMVLVILTIVFFVAMLAETRHASDWKSSILPLVYCELLQETTDADDDGHLPMVKVMENSAKRLRVQLNSAGKGLKFEKAE